MVILNLYEHRSLNRNFPIIVELIAKNKKARNFGVKCITDDSIVIRLPKTSLNRIVQAQEKRRPIEVKPIIPPQQEETSSKSSLIDM